MQLLNEIFGKKVFPLSDAERELLSTLVMAIETDGPFPPVALFLLESLISEAEEYDKVEEHRSTLQEQLSQKQAELDQLAQQYRENQGQLNAVQRELSEANGLFTQPVDFRNFNAEGRTERENLRLRIQSLQEQEAYLLQNEKTLYDRGTELNSVCQDLESQIQQISMDPEIIKNQRQALIELHYSGKMMQWSKEVRSLLLGERIEGAVKSLREQQPESNELAVAGAVQNQLRAAQEFQHTLRLQQTGAAEGQGEDTLSGQVPEDAADGEPGRKKRKSRDVAKALVPPLLERVISDKIYTFTSTPEMFGISRDQFESRDEYRKAVQLSANNVSNLLITIRNNYPEFVTYIEEKFKGQEGRIPIGESVRLLSALKISEITAIFSTSRSVNTLSTLFFILYRSQNPSKELAQQEEFVPLARALISGEEIAGFEVGEFGDDPFTLLEVWEMHKEEIARDQQVPLEGEDGKTGGAGEGVPPAGDDEDEQDEGEFKEDPDLTTLLPIELAKLVDQEAQPVLHKKIPQRSKKNLDEYLKAVAETSAWAELELQKKVSAFPTQIDLNKPMQDDLANAVLNGSITTRIDKFLRSVGLESGLNKKKMDSNHGQNWWTRVDLLTFLVAAKYIDRGGLNRRKTCFLEDMKVVWRKKYVVSV